MTIDTAVPARYEAGGEGLLSEPGLVLSWKKSKRMWMPAWWCQ